MVKGHLVADGPADIINQIDHEASEHFESQTDEGGANYMSEKKRSEVAGPLRRLHQPKRLRVG